jgi:hypothetical protein
MTQNANPAEERRLECRREREDCVIPPLVRINADEPEPPGLLWLVNMDLTLDKWVTH